MACKRSAVRSRLAPPSVDCHSIFYERSLFPVRGVLAGLGPVAFQYRFAYSESVTEGGVRVLRINGIKVEQ